MTKNPFTNIKNPAVFTIKDMYSTVDQTTMRNSRVFKLALQKRYKAFFLLPVIGYIFGQFRLSDNYLTTTLSNEDIRYNREFQRMRFLDEPKFTGHKENAITRQMMVDSGVSENLNKSRKDLVKKNPHYKYF